jgi:hypothetical protein
MENSSTQEEKFVKKTRTDQQKEKLIRTYKIYNVVDWMIAIIIIVTPLAIGTLEGLGLPGISFGSFMSYITNLPAMVIIPVAIISTAYTVWTMILYVKIWPIKEIPKGFQYWFDWLLTFALTAYELFIFYALLFG